LRTILTLFLLASTLSASPVIKTFFDKDFGISSDVPTWDFSVINQSPGAIGFAQTQFGGKPTDGESTPASRTYTFSLPPLAPGASAVVGHAHINNTFEWNPAVDGAVGLMEFSFDLRAIESLGFSSSLGIVGAFYRPVLLQDGIIYRASNSIPSVRPPDNGQWTTSPVTFTFASLADWTRSGVAPNLTSSGGIIRFGFESGIGGSCSSAATANCPAASSFSALDNFFVRVTSVSDQGTADPTAVPEPSTILLLSAGLALLGFRIRRRC
jgi:hypothetical protein